jgi:hypothetical protein
MVGMDVRNENFRLLVHAKTCLDEVALHSFSRIEN